MIEKKAETTIPLPVYGHPSPKPVEEKNVIPKAKVRKYKPISQNGKGLKAKVEALSKMISGKEPNLQTNHHESHTSAHSNTQKMVQKESNLHQSKNDKIESKSGQGARGDRQYKPVNKDKLTMAEKLTNIWYGCISTSKKPKEDYKAESIQPPIESPVISRQTSSHHRSQRDQSQTERTPSKKSISLKKSAKSKASGSRLHAGKISVEEVYKKYSMIYTQV